jgi:uncharacterized protein YcfL
MKKLAFVCVILLAMVACKSSSDGNSGGTANVVMVEGPTFEEGDIFFQYRGMVKNTGAAQATQVKVYIFVYRADGTTIDQEWSLVDSQNLAPQATSTYLIRFSDDGRWIRNQMDHSKTNFEIDWN